VKVGFYIKHIHPNAGGSYSFLKAIQDKLVNATDVEFVFILDVPEYSDKDKFIFLYSSIFEYFVFKANRKICRILGIPYNQEKRIKKILEKEKIDLVWLPGPFELDVSLPYIFTVWDIGHRVIPYFPEVNDNEQWESRERIYTKMLYRASYIFTGNETGKREILENYPMNSEKIRVVPFPTPTVFLNRFSSVSNVSISIEIPYIFYPAQFWAHKNHIVLLETIKYLRANDYKIHCYFSGSDQGNMPYIKSKIKEYGLEEYIHILGFVDSDTLIYLYKNALALAFVSFLGPNNLPPIEAISLGCPVIISNIPGHIEQMGDAAIMVDPTDHIQISDAIMRLLSDNQFRDGLIKKGYILAEKQKTYSYLDRVIAILSEFQRIRRTWR
jgi:glycosyltransferase involved in cell wall biosynthesis